MIKAIMWDLEGVIAHTEDEDISINFAKRLNVPIEKIKKALSGDFHSRLDLGEYEQDEFWDFVVRSIGLPSDHKKYLENLLQEELHIDQLVIHDIQQYRQTFKVALLSNFSKVLRPMLEDYWHIDGVFDKIVISCEIHMLKPDPKIYLYTLEQLECEAQEAIFIDDKVINVEGARAVGLHAFQFTNRQDMNRKIQEIIANNP